MTRQLQLQCIAMTRRAALPRRRDSSVEPTRGYGRLINNGLQLEEVENCRELAGGHAAIAEQLQAYNSLYIVPNRVDPWDYPTGRVKFRYRDLGFRV